MLIKQTLASLLLLLKHSDLNYLRIYHHFAPIKDQDPETGAYPAGSAGSYKRYFITIEKGEVFTYQITIPRLRYKKDGTRSLSFFNINACYLIQPAHFERYSPGDIPSHFLNSRSSSSVDKIPVSLATFSSVSSENLSMDFAAFILLLSI